MLAGELTLLTWRTRDEEEGKPLFRPSREDEELEGEVVRTVERLCTR